MKENKKSAPKFNPFHLGRRLYYMAKRMVDSLKRTVASLLAMVAVAAGFIYMNQDKNETFRDLAQWGESRFEAVVDQVKSQPWLQGKEDDIDRIVSDLKRQSRQSGSSSDFLNRLGQ